MKLFDKYRAYKEYLKDIQDRLIHIEGKVDALMRNEKLLDDGCNQTIEGSCLKVAIKQGGGIGDALLDTQLAKAIYCLAPNNIEIDFYCRAYKLFDNYSFIKNAIAVDKYEESEYYDVIIIMHRLPIIRRFNKSRVWNISQVLYKYLLDCEEMIQVDFQERLDNKLISDYALLKGKNRTEQSNINEILDLNRFTPTYMPIDANSLTVLERYNLLKKKYIVINRGVDSKYDDNHPKLWAKDKYGEVVAYLKKSYPDLLLVQMGDDRKFDYIKGIDINLVEKTSLEECKIILKNSLFLISGEGGLVHFNHFLNGKSIVLFGPTNPKVFGYEENINVYSAGCDSYCEGVAEIWRQKCIKGYKVPPCMDEISVSAVEEAINEMIENSTTSHFYIEKIGEGMQDVISSFELEQSIASIGALEIGIKLKVDLYSDTYIDSDNFIFGSKMNIPVKDGSYDCVFAKVQGSKIEICMQLNELKRIVRDNGIAVVIVDCEYLESFIKSLRSTGVDVSIFNKEKQKHYIKLKKEGKCKM